MNRQASFILNPPGRLAGLAAVLMVLALCWTAFALYSISRSAQRLDSNLLEAVHLRSELVTLVERLARYGEILLHAPEKDTRHEALAEAQALEKNFSGEHTPNAMDTRSKEVLSAVFAQLKELAANRDEQERFSGLIAKRLAAFDALLKSIVETVKNDSDDRSTLLVLTKLRLDLEHADATAETRWELLTSELATRAKVLRLEGADRTAALLDRVPAQVQDLAQLRRRIAAYHRSNHEQWDVAAGLLDQLARNLLAEDTPAEQSLNDLQSKANLALIILLAAMLLSLALGYAAWRTPRKQTHGASARYKSPYKTVPPLDWEGNAPADSTGISGPAADSGPPETGRIESFEESVTDSPETLLPELRNLFAVASPASLALADSLRRQLASGAHKNLADEIYVRAAFGEYGKALESLEKLSSRLREED